MVLPMRSEAKANDRFRLGRELRTISNRPWGTMVGIHVLGDLPVNHDTDPLR